MKCPWWPNPEFLARLYHLLAHFSANFLAYYWPMEKLYSTGEIITIINLKALVPGNTMNDCIWTPPRLLVTCQRQLARLHTYIRPLQMAYADAGP